MADSHSCPNDAQLQSLIDGALPADVQAALAAHLEICETCRHKLDALAGTSVAIPPSGSAVSEPADRSSALAEAMRRLKANQADETATVAAISIGGASLSFLAPSANPRHLGRLAGYEVLEVIGRGGMGIVLKARDPKLERLVAVKVLNPELATSGPARARFLREARSAAAVTHEHVVTIHAVDDAGELPFLVMEYIVGVSLEDRIRRSGHLRLEEILRIGMQAALGLAAAHAQGLVHRDIKPSNILLENGVERVKITDFGLARVVHEAQITQTNLVAGTPQYMSPEQARGEAVDHRSDLFSLGCVLYAMCTGRSPFRAETPTGAIHRVCNDAPRPIREVNPDLPDWLAAVIDRLLEKKPQDRFQTADQVAQVLGQYLAHVQQPSRVELPKGGWRARTIGRGDHSVWQRWAAIAGGIAALVLLSLTAWQLLSGPRAAPNPVTPPPPTRFTPIDLQPCANRSLFEGTDIPENNLSEIGSGPFIANRIPFDIGPKYIQLQGQYVSGCPDAVRGIEVGRKAAKVHILHGVSHTNGVLGQQVATYIFKYQDGSSEEMQVITGRHAREWWRSPKETRLATRATLAWSGSNPAAANVGVQIDVYLCSWENPRPEEQIRSIEVERGPLMKPSAFCLGITCDDDSTPLPPEPGLLFASIGKHWGSSRLAILIDGSRESTIRGEGRHNRLLSPGRHRVEVRDGEILIRSGMITINSGRISYLSIDSPQMLFALPTQQPEPISDLLEQAWVIWDVVVSTDGSTLATAAGDGTVVVWRQDGKAWKEYWRLPPQDDIVRVAAFAPGNDVIAAGNQNGSLALWNVAQKRLLAELISTGPAIRALAYSPDGRLLFSGDADGIVHVWDTAKHVQESSFKVCVGAVNDLVFSADGESLASCGAGENTITLWDANSRSVRRVLTGHTGPVSAVAFSPDSTTIASASEDTTIKAWNLTSGQLLKSLVCPQAISTLAFSPDGKRLAAGGAFHTVQVWDARSYKLLNDFHAHWSDICKVCFLPDGDTLVTAGVDNLTRIWSVADLPEAPDASHNGPSPLATYSVHKDWSMWSSFSSDSSQLVAAVGMVPFDLRSWSLKDPSRVVSLNLRQNDGDHMFQQSMGFLPGEPTLVTCLSRKGKPQIAIWDPQKHVMRDSFEPGSFVPKEGQMSYATSALSPSGTTLALLSQSDASVTLIDVASRTTRWCKRSESGNPSTPAFSPDGKILAVGTKNGLVLLIDASTAEEIREPLTHGTVAVDAIAFSPDGTLASTDKQGIAMLWKFPTFTCEQLPKIHREWIRSAAFSPDGNLLATAAGAVISEPNPGPERGEVCIWDVKLRRILAKFHSHYGCVTSAVFSPDGKRLATTGRDGKMHLWDVEEVLTKAAVQDIEPQKENTIPSPDSADKTE